MKKIVRNADLLNQISDTKILNQTQNHKRACKSQEKFHRNSPIKQLILQSQYPSQLEAPQIEIGSNKLICTSSNGRVGEVVTDFDKQNIEIKEPNSTKNRQQLSFIQIYNQYNTPQNNQKQALASKYQQKINRYRAASQKDVRNVHEARLNITQRLLPHKEQDMFRPNYFKKLEAWGSPQISRYGIQLSRSSQQQFMIYNGLNSFKPLKIQEYSSAFKSKLVVQTTKCTQPKIVWKLSQNSQLTISSNQGSLAQIITQYPRLQKLNESESFIIPQQQLKNLSQSNKAKKRNPVLDIYKIDKQSPRMIINNQILGQSQNMTPIEYQNRLQQQFQNQQQLHTSLLSKTNYALPTTQPFYLSPRRQQTTSENMDTQNSQDNLSIVEQIRNEIVSAGADTGRLDQQIQKQINQLKKLRKLTQQINNNNIQTSIQLQYHTGGTGTGDNTEQSICSNTEKRLNYRQSSNINSNETLENNLDGRKQLKSQLRVRRTSNTLTQETPYEINVQNYENSQIISQEVCLEQTYNQDNETPHEANVENSQLNEDIQSIIDVDVVRQESNGLQSLNIQINKSKSMKDGSPLKGLLITEKDHRIIEKFRRKRDSIKQSSEFFSQIGGSTLSDIIKQKRFSEQHDIETINEGTVEEDIPFQQNQSLHLSHRQAIAEKANQDQQNIQQQFQDLVTFEFKSDNNMFQQTDKDKRQSIKELSRIYLVKNIKKQLKQNINETDLSKKVKSELCFYKLGKIIRKENSNLVRIRKGWSILGNKEVSLMTMRTVDSYKETFKRDVEIRKYLKSRFIQKIYEEFESRKDQIMIYVEDPISSHDLKEVIDYHQKLKEYQAQFFFKQIAFCLLQLKIKKIAHRNINLESFVFSTHKSMILQLRNFGRYYLYKSAKQDYLNTLKYQNQQEATEFTAPEILLKSPSQSFYQHDIWSVGVLLYYMLHGAYPYPKNTYQDIIKYLNDKNYDLRIDPELSDECKDILKQLLTINTYQRITIEEIINHPWVLRQVVKIDINLNNLGEDQRFNSNKSKFESLYSNEDGDDDGDYFSENEHSINSNGTIYFDENYDKYEFYEDDLINHCRSQILSPNNSIIQDKDLPVDQYDHKFLSDNDGDKYFSGKASFLQNAIGFNHQVVEKFDKFYMKKQRQLHVKLENQRKFRQMTQNDIFLRISRHLTYRSEDQKARDKEIEDDLLESIFQIELDDNMDEEQRRQRDIIDENILQKLEQQGIPRQFIMDCLKQDIKNYITASYYLMLKASKEL
ncbi:nuak family snf1-like kinase partial [Stylonychia lemnae]|uniref:Nuak family snf1-like kinase partial n=1 Tax=Stylonychia lemnae TaxID=5949 RepID=A0A078B1D6_STYLE|nr:nuak family snf1-like kinase partial [Stylonychia lemnae]